jgi:transposase
MFLKKFFEHKCKYRERVESLEAEIKELKASLAKKDMEIEALNATFQERLTQLEEKLAQYENQKNSSNSSIPPSQDPYRRKYPKKEKSERPSGGQKGHKGSHHAWEENPDEIIPLHPLQCQHCGSGDLTRFPDYEEARQEIEIPPIKPFVREFRAFACQCKRCGKRSRAPFPEHLKGKVQIGESIENFAVFLKTEIHASHDKIAVFLKGCLNLSVSHGWVQDALERSQKRFLPLYNQIIEALKEQPVLHSDETGCPIAGKKQWLWVFAMENFCAYVAATSRGFKVIRETIGEGFKGSWISDRFPAQLKLVTWHQICLAHLIRDLKWLMETEDSKWAFQVRGFLQKTIQTRNDYEENWNPKQEDIQGLIQQYEAELNLLLSQPPVKAKKGKDKPKALILYEQLNIHKDKILHFLHNPLVPPTNNLAERLLRGFVTHRKVNGEFKTLDGAQGHAVFRSVFQTAKLQGKNIFDVLSHKQSLFQPS